MPLYFAYHRDEYLTSDASLDVVMEFVLGCLDPAFPEESVIWCQGRVVAVAHSDGSVTSFVPAPRAVA